MTTERSGTQTPAAAATTGDWPASVYPVVSARPLPATLDALAAVAEDWGARWEPEENGEGGRLWLPVVAGLRRGIVELRVEAAPPGEAATLLLRTADGELHVHRQAVGILLLSAAGGVMAALWPFQPNLLPLAPVGLVLALSGWFLVVSRLRTSGPEEFAAAVVAAAQAEAAEEEGED
jgi:hypothetical protein